jgi:hypothetical protein
MGFSLGNLNPVKAIDNALVQLDKGVKNYGGWEVVGPAAAALIAAPYLAPEFLAAEGAGALTTSELMGGAGGAFVPTAGSGASFAIPAADVFGGLAGTSGAYGAYTPVEQAAQLTGAFNGVGPTYAEMGYQGANAKSTLDAIAAADAAAKTGGLSGMQKAQLLRMGAGALGQAFTGGQNATGGSGSGSAGGYNYANLPFLANPQSNQTFMKTGQDVSGSGTTVTGMPVQLDTTRHNLLMANLLRG